MGINTHCDLKLGIDGEIFMATVLVVDDTQDTCDILKRLFSRCGHLVDCLLGGEHVVPAMRSIRYDLVLLDVMMPEIDGFAVLAAIRNDAQLRLTPVAMYSAISDPKDQRRAIDLGANEWIVKGTPFSLLRQRLECFLGERGALSAVPLPRDIELNVNAGE